MKYFLVLFLCVSHFAFAQQQKTITHTVSKGETITKIAQKYNVTPLDIYKLNPDAQNGVKENTVLLIPNKSAIPAKKVSVKHEVLAKETLYSLSKQYNVSIEAIEKANAEALKEGVKVGMILIIPADNSSIKGDTTKATVFHEVKAKETKYSIAKQYGISIEQLEKQNPDIANELPIGYKLIISGGIPVKSTKVDAVTVETPKSDDIAYIVKPKETLYSLSNQFGMKQDELIALNPELKNGVQEGMTLKIPAKNALMAVKKDYKDLTKTYNKQANKKLAILLPFNITRLDKDTINSTKALLKKDKFLNMTLDFYAGALMAIDSVNKMGLRMDVTILDSEETKSTSNVANLIQRNNLKTMDAIIGPFYQNNVEKAAELLSPYNVPVISPLSKDYDKVFTNLIQSTPSNDDIKKAMFDFMRAKNGNMIAIVDQKKLSVKQYITDNHQDVLFTEFNEKGGLNVEHLKTLLVKDRTNFVIMETEKTNLILSTTNALVNALAGYDIKLVILGENDALDYEEINIEKLTKLKMHYPSITRVNESAESTIFENNFKKKNKIYPNQFATRGFDITFDILMRLSQEKPLVETLDDAATEQVENKFDYFPNSNGGHMNKGVYILYYDTDLTIKEAK